jgi:hypothetical protein
VGGGNQCGERVFASAQRAEHGLGGCAHQNNTLVNRDREAVALRVERALSTVLLSAEESLERQAPK